MTYISRALQQDIKGHLAKGRSILLLGPRQTGKTTLIEHLNPDIHYSFGKANTRQRYENNPALLKTELEEQIKTFSNPPVIFIDEIQKIPTVMDIAQHLIDRKLAQFILAGSSARKLKQASENNVLPGHLVVLHMTPLLFQEIPEPKISLEQILLYGTLPRIVIEKDDRLRETDLASYVVTYLEEEIRAEALVRNVGSFGRFLEMAAGESGKQLNYSHLSQNIGVSDTTIASYYQILEDCFMVNRIDPLTNSQTKRRLIKSPKYLFFDLGIRRLCANEGLRLPQKILGELFEQYVGNELIYQTKTQFLHAKVQYWRDAAGPGIDYVLDVAQQYIPIKVRWSDKPMKQDAKHLEKFMNEHPESKTAYIVCRTPRRYKIDEHIMAIPWQEISTIFERI